MASTVTIDLRHVARGLDFSLRQVQAVVELLDEGNTVPFITRYRKDQTGGLDEEQVREIQDRLVKMRLLADRKQTILRSIEAQGKLDEKLAKQILAATTTKRLEDLYLPYKPKKQTLATLARSRGLEELAKEILEAAPSCADLDARARDFANPDRQVPTGADALLGAGHILAEQFSERADLRQRLREILQRTGAIVTTQIGGEPAPAAAPVSAARTEAATPAAEPAATAPVEATTPAAGEPAVIEPAAAVVEPAPIAIVEVVEPVASPPAEAVPAQAVAGEPAAPPAEMATAEAVVVEPTIAEAVVAEAAATEVPAAETAVPVEATEPAAEPPKPLAVTVAKRAKEREKAKAAKQNKKEQKKKKLEERRIKAFRDYFNYGEEINRIPPHRVLAINRGERAKVLRVKIESDLAAMHAALEELIAPDHPHAEYIRGCARDALARLILPALEREARRELTDRAELHAVGVFARNLRNLLLQPPIHNRRVLAVDPGFKSGCKLAALDQFGNVLGHDVIMLVGKPARKQEAKEKSLALIRKFELTVIAIGNGTACRDTEDFFAELITEELKDQGVAYVIVNEAGASVYSTSQAGREEFPEYDATLRGAISIGRRLLDPLSELVKIEAGSIGVGLYQHDVKAKHLQVSLDEVVESCVNYVGVDVNTASPALLRYVSGLNQLTARRVYEHRREHGPFRNREQLRAVPGFGEATFVQAAGFLKITGGDNPLDLTWIHPESYSAASQILQRFNGQPGDLTDKESASALAQRLGTMDVPSASKELGVGELTLRDILSQLARPGRDPREDLPAPVFKQGVLKLEDLSAGMELTGTVLNVVDFGCFVDIGMHDSGLVHVSRLADRFIRDPHEVVAVGDIVKVWVMEVDKERRRVSLTMVRPGSERPRRPMRDEHAAADGEAPQGEHATEGAAASGPRGPQQGGRPPQGRGGRPQGGRPQGGRPAQGDRPQGGRPPQGGRSGDRPPRHEGAPQGGRPPRSHGPGRGGYGGQGGRGPTEFKPKPKPLIPISEAMKKGKEPMRTFGDLMQFFETKTLPEQAEQSKKPGGKKGAKPASAPPPPVASLPPVVAEPPVASPPPAEPLPPESLPPEPAAAEPLPEVRPEPSAPGEPPQA
jgi:uncharacterized protein